MRNANAKWILILLVVGEIKPVPVRTWFATYNYSSREYRYRRLINFFECLALTNETL